MIKELPTQTSTLLVKFPSYAEIPDFIEKSSAKKLIVRAIAKLISSGSAQILYTGNNSDNFLEFDSASSKDNGIIVRIHVIGKCSLGFDLPAFGMLKKYKQVLMNNSEHIVIEKTNPTNSGTRFIEIYTRNSSVQTIKSPAYQHQPSTRYDFSAT